MDATSKLSVRALILIALAVMTFGAILATGQRVEAASSGSSAWDINNGNPVTVGDTYSYVFTIDNNSTAPNDTDTVTLNSISGHPSCNDAELTNPPCATAANQNPGVFSNIGNGTGVAGTACDGENFTISIDAAGVWTFTPDDPVVLGPSDGSGAPDSCEISGDLSVDSLPADAVSPFGDADGVQTVQVSRAAGRNTPSGLLFLGQGSASLTVLQTADLLLSKVDQDGAPQEGVLLEVTGPSPETTTFECTTDDTGTCTITGLVPGEYDVSEPTPPEGYAFEGCTPDPVAVVAGQTATVTCTNEIITGGEGCTPGYWKQEQHFDSWVGYSPDDSFEDVFGVDVTLRGNGRTTIDDPTLLEALDANGGGINALARHAVAALLNAANPDVSYAFTEAQVIAMVQEAVESGDFETAHALLAAENERGCPLN